MDAAPSPSTQRTAPRAADIVAATILGLVQPGLGQIYLGSALRSLAIYGAIMLLLALVGLSGFLSRFSGFVIANVVWLNVYLGLAIDAGFLAWRRGRVRTLYNRWFVLPLVVVVLFGANYALRRFSGPIFGYAVSRIPSGAMEPTLLIGDYILYDTRSYGAGRPPARGDVIVFKSPPDPHVSYVKRVAAVGGDRLELGPGKLIVNGETVEEPYLKGPIRDAYATTVPPGEVFVLGDHRDRSSDSRVWGPVKNDAVTGRVTCILMSPSRVRFGLALDEAWKVKPEEAANR